MQVPASLCGNENGDTGKNGSAGTQHEFLIHLYILYAQEKKINYGTIENQGFRDDEFIFQPRAWKKVNIF